MPDLPRWHYFWAKTDRSTNADGTLQRPEWTRPLWAHLLDVAHSALLLWEVSVPHTFRKKLAQTLNLSVKEAGYVLSFLIGLHDIGKAIPSFQKLHDPSRKTLEALGLNFRDFPVPLHHGHASIVIMQRWMRSGTVLSDTSLGRYLSAFVGYHHGLFVGKNWWRSQAKNINLNIFGDTAWDTERYALLDAVAAAWFSTYPLASSPTALHDESGDTTPPWLLGFAGWTTLADWLGSMAECFPDVTVSSPQAYLATSRAAAQAALKKAGFYEPSPLTYTGFSNVFPFTPNALQKTLETLPLSEEPMLVIAEAPTGEGKTEGAFALAGRQQHDATPNGGLYIAMPSQATSNGLFARTLTFLNKTTSGGNFRLVHGNADLHDGQHTLFALGAQPPLTQLAAWQDSPREPKKGDASPSQQDDATTRMYTLRWFLNKKRALLAPYGLGTVDQAFLGILHAKHFFLRLYGLVGKTVIFDEVHAYDFYMSHLFIRLLEWLRALGTHVILLSATLPTEMRQRCLEAWGAPVRDAPTPAPYPAIWVSDGTNAYLEDGGFKTSWHQNAELKRLDPTPGLVAQEIKRLYDAGAVIGVICNTVRRAQAIYAALEDLRLPKDDLLLFHARYIFRHRQDREAKAIGLFGKACKDRQPKILVATQVAEQSLDLDFDVLFTDLAPIDLLLQRAGRLHRHLQLRPPDQRPALTQTPAIYWLCPDADPSDLPDLSPIGINTTQFSVYDALIVWKTWQLLRTREAWSLPADYRFLVDTVYNEDVTNPFAANEAGAKLWTDGVKQFRARQGRARTLAREQHIPEPQYLAELLSHTPNEQADPDDPKAHKTRRALTRDGSDSAEAIVLFQDDTGALFLDGAYETPAPLTIPRGREDLPRAAVKQLLGNSIRLSYEGVIQSVLQTEAPASWKTAVAHTPSLTYRLPLVLTNRSAIHGSYILTYDDDRGLLIAKTS